MKKLSKLPLLILVFCYFPEPPVFKGDYPSNWIEPLGGNAILNCEVKGDPAPTIQWSRKGVDIEINHRIRQLGNGSLAIYGTVVSHTGIVDYALMAFHRSHVWGIFLLQFYLSHEIWVNGFLLKKTETVVQMDDC